MGTRNIAPGVHSTPVVGPHSLQLHRHGSPKQPELLLALRSSRMLSDRPLISSASTAQASMRRNKMTFGFLQRTADNLERLKNSLFSHSNHLFMAGQQPGSAGTMLLERLSVDLGSSSSCTQSFSIQMISFSF